MNMKERICRNICAKETGRDFYSKIVDELWPNYKEVAECALVAMEDPTDHMVRVARNASNSGSFAECVEIYKSMIQTAQDEE